MTEQGPYADILDHPRHVSLKHAPLSKKSRAAQFAPFDALKGMDEKMKEAEDEGIRKHTRKEADEFDELWISD